MTLTVGSMCSGIGGLDLGLERAGMEVIWQSEIDKYASKVLARHWKETPNLGDIKRVSWGDIVRPDVVCAGYPCQPFSTAGRRRGEDDPRHLWPWVRDAIRVLRPRYAIFENVRGHITLGLPTVLGDLASLGYDAEWTVVSAASVGAPHIRERLFIVAYTACECGNVIEHHSGCRMGSETATESGNDCRSSDVAHTDSASREQHIAGTGQESDSGRRGEDVADTDLARSQGRHRAGDTQRQDPGRHIGSRGSDVSDGDSERNGINRITTDASIFGGCWEPDRRGKAWNVARQWWAVEPDVGRVAHGVPSRVDRLRTLGNAVVPQVAEFVGRLVVDHHRRTTGSSS